MRKQVIISRMLVISLMIISAIGASAQSSFRNAVKDYMAYNSDYAVDKARTALLEQNSMFFESSANLEQLTAKYLEERYLEDMADIMEPIFTGKVTEADLRKFISLMSTPESKLMAEHTQQWSEKFKEELSAYLQAPFSDVLDGKEPKPVERNGNITPEFALKFAEYMDNSGLGEEMVNVFCQTLSSLGMEVPDMFRNWMTNNMTTMAMNSAYGVFTIADLEQSSKLFTNDSYRNVSKASLAIVSDPMSLGSIVMKNYMDWMQEHGATLSSTGEQALLFYLNVMEGLSK